MQNADLNLIKISVVKHFVPIKMSFILLPGIHETPIKTLGSIGIDLDF